MAAFGVTATDVNDAIRRDNFISAAGTTRGELVRASVDAETDVQDPETFAAIVVRQEGDQRQHLVIQFVLAPPRRDDGPS